MLCALSGGVDSSVLAAMLAKAIGKQLTCVFVDHGLLRKNEKEEVCAVFGPGNANGFDINFICVDARDRYFSKMCIRDRSCWKEKRRMPFDYKKEYKEFYLPPKKPQIITVPAMNFVAVQGKGDPNDPAGEYKAALELLYGMAFTIKMSYKGSHKMNGYFEYVVPPLEGLWHQPGAEGVDFSNKETFIWTSMILSLIHI